MGTVHGGTRHAASVQPGEIGRTVTVQTVPVRVVPTDRAVSAPGRREATGRHVEPENVRPRREDRSTETVPSVDPVRIVRHVRVPGGHRGHRATGHGPAAIARRPAQTAVAPVDAPRSGTVESPEVAPVRAAHQVGLHFRDLRNSPGARADRSSRSSSGRRPKRERSE